MSERPTIKPIRRLKSKLKTIPIDAIEIPMDRPRAYQDEQSARAIASSIATIGVLQPIGVRELRKGRYVLVYGESRLKEARAKGYRDIEARVFYEGEPEELEIYALIENLGRGQVRPIDVFNAIERFRDRGYNLREIADLTGLSYDSIKHYNRILNAETYLKEAVVAGKLGVKHVEQLLRIKNPRLRKETAAIVLRAPRPWTVSELRAYIDHGVFALCDECGKRDENVKKIGAVWLCPECRARVGLVPRTRVETPTPTFPCIAGEHEIALDEVRRILLCDSCRQKIFAWIDSFRIIKGKPISQATLEECRVQA